MVMMMLRAVAAVVGGIELGKYLLMRLWQLWPLCLSTGLIDVVVDDERCLFFGDVIAVGFVVAAVVVVGVAAAVVVVVVGIDFGFVK